MKKLITIFLVLAMCLAMFAGCAKDPVENSVETTAPVETVSDLESARAYLKAMYKDKGGKVLRDFDVVKAVIIGTTTFPIEWTVNVTAGKAEDVTVVVADNNVTVDINEKPEEQTEFTLVGTVKDEAGQTKSVEINYFIEAAPKAGKGPTLVEAPKAGVPYKFALLQANLGGKYLYFTGEIKGKYLQTSESALDAVDVMLEDVEGGSRIYFMDGEVKTYIDVQEYDQDGKTKSKIVLTTEPACVYTWDETLAIFTTKLAGGTYYLGTYNEFNTFSASSTNYINPDNKGIKQFPGEFYTVAFNKEIVEAPTAGTFKAFMRQENRGEDLYFTGKISGKFLVTSTNALDAVDVTVEAVEGGYRFFIMDGEAKTYIDVQEYDQDGKTKSKIVLTTEPACVYTWDETLAIYTTTLAGGSYYIGAYNDFNTFSASATKYINPDNKGIKQFPLQFVTLKFANKVAEPPVEKTPYTVYLRQENRGEDLYFTGKITGKYLVTSKNPLDAVDVFVENVEGGVRFYFMDGEAKTYIDVQEYDQDGKTKSKIVLTTEPACVYTWDETLAIYTTTLAGGSYYLGAYNDFNTISASATKYINVDNKGIKQFPVQFAIVDIA